MGAALLSALCLPSCATETPAAAPAPVIEPTVCVAGPVPAAFAPGVDAALERADRWLPESDDDPILADAARLGELRARTSAMIGGGGDPWRAGVDATGALSDARRRIASFAAELRGGEIVEEQVGAIAAAQSMIEHAEPLDHARLVVEPTQLFCTPVADGLWRVPERDHSFDRNACTGLHPGELVRVLARADAGRWLLVDAGHTSGWVRPAGLSARIDEDARRRWREGTRVWALRDDVRTSSGVALRMGVGLPLLERGPAGVVVGIATPDGPGSDTLPTDAAVTLDFAPLRRSAVLRAALSQMGAPYGWGGRADGRDCSQFLHDTFAPFGVALPRHSSLQAEAGLTTIDVAGWSAADKLAAIERAGQTGLVIEYMPGHVMLDVGAVGGRRLSISAIAEFLVPCPDGTAGGDTIHRLDRVALTDLELGRDTARGAFIDRITKLAVFGPP